MRTDDYVRGYEAAMKYAAEFARDCGSGSMVSKLTEILASHYEEKARSTADVVALERKIARRPEKAISRHDGAAGVRRNPLT